MQAALVIPNVGSNFASPAVSKHQTPKVHCHRPLKCVATLKASSAVSTQTANPPEAVTSESTEKLNKYSSRITEPKSQGASQAVLYGVGLGEDDMSKPQVGISSVWYEGNTCNMHLLSLAEAVKEGVQEAGMIGFRFNTIGVSDAISMGTRGMCYSLQSRDLIADSIETVMSAQWYDGNISIPGCDKNMPGTIMAMGRLNRPSIMIYGGTIKPGHFQNQTLDIVSAFQCYGEFVSGKIDDDQRMNVIRNSCPGAGACGGMYTANTMASAIETMGMSLPYSSSTPAEDPLKLDECRLAGKYLLDLLKMDLKPQDIITEKSLRNAMVVVMALGGSTNAVLHLIAIARSVGVNLPNPPFPFFLPFLRTLKTSSEPTERKKEEMATVPGALVWEIVKKNNCFLVKEFGNGTSKVQFSKESNNLYNAHTYKYSGLANTKTVSIQPGGKDSVVLATTKTRKQNKPASLQHKSVMKKEFRRMAKAVENQVGDNYYRPDLKKAALARLSVVNRSLQVAKFGVKKKNRQPSKIRCRK